MSVIVPGTTPGANFEVPVTLPVAQLLDEGGSKVRAAGVPLIVLDGSPAYLPAVGAVTTAWTAPGAEIAESAVESDRIVVEPSKVASFALMSREVADDSAMLGALQRAIARSLARTIDEAVFDPAPGTDAPASWISAANPTAVNYDPSALAADADSLYGALVEARWAVADSGGTASICFMSPSSWKDALSLRDADGRPLLADLASGTVASLGLGVTVTNAVPDGQVVVVDPMAVAVAVRRDVEVTVDPSAAFRADSLAVRGVARVAPVVCDPSGLVLIEALPAGS